MTDKNIFEKEEKEVKKEFFSPAPSKTAKVKRGIVANITTSRITVDFNGTGESIPFEESKHKNLKIGDTIEF